MTAAYLKRWRVKAAMPRGAHGGRIADGQWRHLIPCLLVLGFCALPTVWRVDPFWIDPALVLRAPGWAHPLGTDALGRDELSRLLSGGRATLEVAVPGAFLAFVLGVLYGLVAGLGPNWLDRVMMRVLDAVLALPALVLMISLAALVELNTLMLAGVIGIVGWPSLARLARSETRALLSREYILVSQQMGAGGWHLARTHLLPALAPLLAVNASLLVGDAILGASSLSFLGLGVPPPQTSWGGLIAEGLALVPLHAWWLILPAGAMTAFSVYATSAASRFWTSRRA